MKKILLFLSLVVGILSAEAKGFDIYKGGKMAQIYLAADEAKPLQIAAQHLQDDIEMVTGVRPEIIHDSKQLSGNVISLSVDVDGEAALKGLYESYLMRSGKPTTAEVSSLLEVVGSDATGAAYGVYNISKMIGVSPLYWYCDLTPARSDVVTIKECEIAPKQPSVRYRGIFINDEEAKIQWSRNTSKDRNSGFISPESYKRVFELMMRLGVNTLWPSMMEEGAYFFEAEDENGVAINPRNATDYGVYVSTSHCENIARNNNAEWYDWAAENSHLFSDDLHEFDYTVNPKAIEQYWRERLEECRDFNIIYTMGIRAVHDSHFKHRLMVNPTLEQKVNFIQKVLDRQREIIAEVYGSADAVPQIFVPYEEMAEFYNGETKNGSQRCKGLELPDDVMIISTDDNYGYLRQLPSPSEVNRKGGAGIYYHLAYQGNPSPYDWLTTMPFKQLQQEMRKLQGVGAMSFWMVNVGDIKPSELALSFFMDMAIDADRYLNMNPRDYVAAKASELFAMDQRKATEFADLYTRFCQAANIQKPEFMTGYWVVDFDKSFWQKFAYYSTADFNDEAERMIAQFVEMEREAKALYDSLPEDRRDIFWHLGYYPIRSTMLMAQKSYYYYKNKIYAKQGRFASVNGYKRLSLAADAAIDSDLEYYNKELQGGKWDGIMDPYAFYNIYERVVDDANISKDLVYKEYFAEQGVDALGSVCEGQVTGAESVDLLFSSLEDNRRFVDLFSRGVESQSWSIESGAKWVKISETSGEVSSEQRVWVSIDWKQLAEGQHSTTITVKGDGGEVKSYPIVAQKIGEKIKPRTYVEGAGYIAIEAERYTTATKGGDGSEWIEVKDFGYCGSSMVVNKMDRVDDPTRGATLEYQLYFTTTGTFDAIIYRLPTLNEGKGKSCELAVSVNGGKPVVIEGMRRKDQSLKRTLASGKSQMDTWRGNAFIQMEKLPVTITIDKAGYNVIKIHQMDGGIGFDRIVIPTTAQSALAQSRSMVGAPESYNTFTKSYDQPIAVAAPLTEELTKVDGYPELEPLLYAKFLFGKQGIPEYWGFTTMTTHHVYDKNANLYGWDPEGLEHIKTRQVVGSRLLPYYRLFSHRSDKPASFCATVLEGNYEVLVFTGNNTEYYSGAKGQEYTMTLKANGVVLMDDLFVESDKPYIGRFDVKVGKDNLLKLDFSGKDGWGISVIEIYRK
ncbi:MAG: glycosyl hydrolase 115 family protein [Rikenellaceae bacterium]